MSLIWPVGFPSSRPLCSFVVCPFFEHFLTFWNKMSQVLPVLILPQPWNQPFLQSCLEALVWYRYAYQQGCHLLPGVDRAGKYMYTQVHLYVFLNLSAYIDNHELTSKLPCSTPCHSVHVSFFSLSVFATLVSDSRKPWHYPRCMFSV